MGQEAMASLFGLQLLLLSLVVSSELDYVRWPMHLIWSLLGGCGGIML